MTINYKRTNFGNLYLENSNKRFHSENDLPAVIYTDGDMYWYKNGDIHRENAPAIISKARNMEHWYLNNIQYEILEDMPLSLFLSYCKWEYNKHGK